MAQSKSLDNVFSLNGYVNVKQPRYGARGDGTTDDSAAIGAAIDAANGRAIIWPAGTYLLGSVLSKTLTAPQFWRSEGPVTLRYTGAAGGPLITLTLGSNDFFLDGQFTIDCDLLARVGMRINNSPASMAGAVNLLVRGLKVIDAYSVTNGTDAAGIMVGGAFNLVKLVDCGAQNVSRAAGVGVPGVTGSAGISVFQNSASAYPKRVVIEDPTIETITSEEPDGGGNNVDCDGVIVNGPSAASFSGVPPETILLVRGGRFRNCRGRCVKSQMQSNDVDGIQIIRDSAAQRAITNATEVDFQWGAGKLRNYTVKYEALSGGGNPFGASHAVVNASGNNVATNGEGAFVVENGYIFNEYPLASGDLPYFCLLSVDAAGLFRSVSVQKNTMLGGGRVGQFVRGALARVIRLDVEDNYIHNLTQSLVHTTVTGSEVCVGNVSGNHNNGTERAIFTADAGSLPTLSVHGNTRFSMPAGTSFRTLADIAGGSQGAEKVIKNNDGRLFFDTLTLNDEASGTITLPDSIGYMMITSTFDQTVSFLGTHFSTTFLTVNSGGSANVSVGAGSNPDVAGDLNIWLTNGGLTLNMKNRLGSARGFYVWDLIRN